jgi:predicted nuclease of predicted toxin-antitoxin system
MGWQELPTPPKQELSEVDRVFKKKARFLVDESLGEEAANLLRDLGWNVAYAADVSLAGKDDETVYGFAWRAKRIILTHDKDFLDDRRFPPQSNPGVVVLPGGSGSTAALVAGIRDVGGAIGRYALLYKGEKIAIAEDGSWVVKGLDRPRGVRCRERYKFGPGGRMWKWEGPTDDG